MNAKDLLQKPNIYLEWVEPWLGMDNMGIATDVIVTLRATVKDCVNRQRELSKGHNYPLLSEEDLLADFMAIKWATVIRDSVNEKKIKEETPQLRNV
jgi:hypothetical protein